MDKHFAGVRCNSKEFAPRNVFMYENLQEAFFAASENENIYCIEFYAATGEFVSLDLSTSGDWVVDKRSIK